MAGNFPHSWAAQQVQSFRTENGWTQRDAARWYGCSPRSWRRWELGERAVPLPLIKRIAESRDKGRRRQLAAV